MARPVQMFDSTIHRSSRHSFFSDLGSAQSGSRRRPDCAQCIEVARFPDRHQRRKPQPGQPWCPQSPPASFSSPASTFFRGMGCEPIFFNLGQMHPTTAIELAPDCGQKCVSFWRYKYPPRRRGGMRRKLKPRTGARRKRRPGNGQCLSLNFLAPILSA